MKKQQPIKGAKIRFRNRRQFYNTIREDVGGYILDELPKDHGYSDAEITEYINEIDFYTCYLHLKASLARTVYQSSTKLTDVNIEYMAAIMAKPLDFTMPTNSKNSVQSGLAKELGRTPKSAYSAINRLRKAGYLVITEDSIITPNSELQTLRKVTKKHLENMGVFPVCYMMNFVVYGQGSSN